MSTSPRARARPSIDAPSTGSTMPGKSVTMSIRIPYLQVEQALGRADHHPARLEVDLAHDLRDRRDQVLTRLVCHDPEVLRRRPLDADRKSTRLNSSHGYISYAVFCLKKKKTHRDNKYISQD